MTNEQAAILAAETTIKDIMKGEVDGLVPVAHINKVLLAISQYKEQQK